MAASSEAKKPIMDVSKPGETSAAPTTRPIISNHGSIIKDPMVSTDETSPDIEPAKAEEPAPAPSTKAKVIQPPASAEPAKKEEPESEEPAAAEDEPKEPETDKPEDTGSSEAVVDAVIDQAVSKKKDDKLTEEEIKQQETIEKLVADKTYFVPVGQVKRRHRRMALVAILLIALVLAGLFAYGVQSGRIHIDNLPQF